VFSYLHFREVGLEGAPFDYAPVNFIRSNTTENTTHHNHWELPDRPERTTIPYEQRAATTGPTHQNRLHSPLNQQVPGSSPGRRTIDAENHRNGLVQGGSLPGVLEHSGEPSVDRFGPDLLSETGTMSIRT